MDGKECRMYGERHKAQYTGIKDDDSEEFTAVSPLMKKRKR